MCILIFGCDKLPVIESPAKIPRDSLHFYDGRTQIDLDEYVWIYYNLSDTNSMYPTITKNSHGIGLKLKEDTVINVGDIISFKVKGFDHNYAHRVIEIGYDEEGEYFITKGDNNRQKDDIKIRRKDIDYVVAAIIY